MKEIIKINNLFSITAKPLVYSNEEKYRFFSFVVKLKVDDNYLLFNTLTRQLILLTDEEYLSIELDEITEQYKYLIENYFIVPETFDDNKLKNQIISLAKMFSKRNELNHFVVFPTMDCNARCFYCFENGAKKFKMSNKTAEDVADFIIRKSNNKVKIQWFGGEPLYNIDAIDIISRKLHENNIKYESTMISNGYLFNQEIIEKAKKLWNLKQVQITLDGTEDIYNRVKNYIYDSSESPFWRVINNIELLVKNGVFVLIRLNMDKYNKNDLFNLVSLLNERFNRYTNYVTIYSWLLYDSRGNKNIRNEEERHNLTDDLIQLEEYIKECGFISKSLPNEKIPIYACLADNPCSAVILPSGKLGKCDHHSDDELYGSIYSEDMDVELIKSWTVPRIPVELCNECPIAPECKRLKKCPDDSSFDCDIFEQKKRIQKIKNKMINAYNKYVLENE